MQNGRINIHYLTYVLSKYSTFFLSCKCLKVHNLTNKSQQNLELNRAEHNLNEQRKILELN
jgi:hypothetical protein